MTLAPDTAQRAQLLSDANLKRVCQAIARNTPQDSDDRDLITIRVKQSKRARTYDDGRLRTASWTITRERRWLPLGNDIFLTADGHLATLLPESEWHSENPIGTYVSSGELSAKQTATAIRVVESLMTQYRLVPIK